MEEKEYDPNEKREGPLVLCKECAVKSTRNHVVTYHPSNCDECLRREPRRVYRNIF